MKKILVVLVVLSVASPVNAMRAKDYLELKKSADNEAMGKLLKAYIDGMKNGIMILNEVYKVTKNVKLFCPSDKLTIGSINAMVMIDSAIDNYIKENNRIEHILIFELIKTFPCDK